MDTPAVAGSLEAVSTLLEAFEHRVHVVSKAGPKISELSRRWLGKQGLLGDHAIPSGQIHFVRRRPDKHEVCERLGVTHFVDDRLDVLQHLIMVENRYLFLGGLGANKAPDVIPDPVVASDSWASLTDLLVTSLDERSHG